MDRAAYDPYAAVFSITICTAARRPIFADHRYARPMFASILEGPLASEADLFAACLMPEHLHLRLMPTATNAISLIGRWKIFSTNLLHRLGHTGPVWQRSFHDHALRGDEAEATVAFYIANNPVRRGLVAEWSHYPYAWLKWGS
jgi:REP element-mobilizing transposase RayT